MNFLDDLSGMLQWERHAGYGAEMTDRMARRPYVGITGFMCADEVRAALTAYREAWGDRTPTHDLMVGVLVTSKTLCGQIAKQPLRYPAMGDVAGIFVDDPLALNVVHVCPNSDPSAVDGRRIPLEIDAIRAIAAGGPLCHGLQINTASPTWRALSTVRGCVGKDARLILQARPAWLHHRLAGTGGNLDTLVMFSPCVTDLLIDVSCGTGKVIDPADASSLVAATRKQLKHFANDGMIRVGVAGGLSADTLPALTDVARVHHGLSFDAESGVRDSADGGGNLDMDKVRAYLRTAVSLLTETA